MEGGEEGGEEGRLDGVHTNELSTIFLIFVYWKAKWLSSLRSGEGDHS